MPGTFAAGIWSRAICDRCGLKMAYADLVTEVETNLRVHERCLDEPLTYWKPRNEPQALRDPRPDFFEATIDDTMWSADGTFVTADSTLFTADAA